MWVLLLTLRLPSVSCQVGRSVLCLTRRANYQCNDIPSSIIRCRVCVGKYSETALPPGPRGILFKQLLPEIQPVLRVIEDVAKSRRKTMSQVSDDRSFHVWRLAANEEA